VAQNAEGAALKELCKRSGAKGVVQKEWRKGVVQKEWRKRNEWRMKRAAQEEWCRMGDAKGGNKRSGARGAGAKGVVQKELCKRSGKRSGAKGVVQKEGRMKRAAQEQWRERSGA
jgi:hypothetical protein